MTDIPNGYKQTGGGVIPGDLAVKVEAHLAKMGFNV